MVRPGSRPKLSLSDGNSLQISDRIVNVKITGAWISKRSLFIVKCMQVQRVVASLPTLLQHLDALCVLLQKDSKKIISKGLVQIQTAIQIRRPTLSHI